MAAAEYTTDTTAGELRLLGIGQIIPGEDNPRRTLTELDDLAASIRAVGLLTPVLVEDNGDGTFRLVAGHRRHAACQMAGLTDIPALVKRFDPVGRKAAALVENGQRVALTQMEEAAAYQDLLSLDVDADTLARSVGRPRAEVDGRLAVFALPASVHQMLADDALTYAEALLLTTLAEYPADIEKALAKCDQWGWTVGQAVEHALKERARSLAAIATRDRLLKQKVRIIDAPEHGYLTSRNTEKQLGTGWDEVGITKSAHKKEQCHAAYIRRDGAAVFVCTEPKRHQPERSDGGAPVVDAKAERAAKRAANKARRQASADRIAMATALLAQEGNLDMHYLTGAILDHAPREILPAAARLLGLEVPAGQQWAASEPAEKALREYAGTEVDTRLRVALAVHWALAEKDAVAEHETFRGGPGVIAYTDLLVANGYTETAGDAANRDRYGRRSVADFMGDDDEGEPTADDGEPDE